MAYKGYKVIVPNEEELAALYSLQENKYELLENEYLIVKDNDNKVIDYFQWKNNKLETVGYNIIEGSFFGRIKARNPEQYLLFHLLKDDDVGAKLVMGPAGSGKTFCCVAAALEAIEHNKFEKICFVRNNVQVKLTDAIGALPGGLNDKLVNYVLPFADHCGGVDGIERLFSEGKLEIVPLAYMRGRSIKNAIIYVTEAENLTREHLQMILQRADEGSTVWFDGDTAQRDKVEFERSQGLEVMIERLRGQKEFGFVELEKIERSNLARLGELLG